MKKTDVLDFFGGAKRTSEILRIDRSAITRWGDEIPEDRAFHIHGVTCGKLTDDHIEKRKLEVARDLIENDSMRKLVRR